MKALRKVGFDLCRLVALALLVLSCGASPSFAQNSPGSAAERTALFRWFDSLGLPDLTKYPLVEVTNRAWAPYYDMLGRDDSVERNLRRKYGFLLEDREGRFTVLCASLITVTLVKSRDFTNYKLIDPATLATTWLAQQKGYPKGWMAAGLDAFVLARVCAAKGDSRSAKTLFRFAMERASLDYFNKCTRQERLRAEFARYGYAHSASMLYDVSVSRSEIKAQVDSLIQRLSLESLVKQFPNFGIDGVLPMQKTLDLMVEEDRAHDRKTSPPLERLPLKERIAELIFRLRDNAGRDDIFMRYKTTKQAKYHASEALEQIGYPAIPQLMEALDNPRFTREGGRKIGDEAENTVWGISGHRLNMQQGNDRPMTRSEVKRQALEWWAKMKVKGERKMLTEATESGEGDAQYTADILARKYPALALQSIAKGLQKATGKYVVRDMLHAAASLKGDESLHFLQSLAQNDKRPAVREDAKEAIKYRRF